MTPRSARPFAVVAMLATVATGRGEDWPGWRGPTGMGVSDEKDLPLTWGGKDDENVLWKVPLPGAEGKAKPRPEPVQPHRRRRPRRSSPVSYWPDGVDSEGIPRTPRRLLPASDGKPLWDTTVPPGPWQLSDLRGGYTAPTPAADGERVYVAVRLVRPGRPRPRRQAALAQGDHAVRLRRGRRAPARCSTARRCCSSATRSSKRSRLLAFDRKTGDVKWEQKRPDADFSHSTPVVAEVGGKPQLLVAGVRTPCRVSTPTDGKLLWSAPPRTRADSAPRRSCGRRPGLRR